MTRAQCETIIAQYLEDIRDTIREYDPTINNVSLAIEKNYAWAFTIKDKENEDDDTEYLLNVTTENGFSPDGGAE